MPPNAPTRLSRPQLLIRVLLPSLIRDTVVSGYDPLLESAQVNDFEGTFSGMGNAAFLRRGGTKIRCVVAWRGL